MKVVHVVGVHAQVFLFFLFLLIVIFPHQADGFRNFEVGGRFSCQTDTLAEMSFPVESRRRLVVVGSPLALFRLLGSQSRQVFLLRFKREIDLRGLPAHGPHGVRGAGFSPGVGVNLVEGAVAVRLVVEEVPLEAVAARVEVHAHACHYSLVQAAHVAVAFRQVHCAEAVPQPLRELPLVHHLALFVELFAAPFLLSLSELARIGLLAVLAVQRPGAVEHALFEPTHVLQIG
mmetsp:Transcript_31228/g.58128  ORF Transcript_31228/g.58128 Transcript_31228/m.58128 type:complete len:232 (-) Transcript_31228:476-1171(-)